MAKQYVLTLTAANRVGILAAVTNAIAELGGDLQEARQTVVQKFFSLVLSAEFPDHREPHVIVDHIQDIGRPYGIKVCLKDPEKETLQSDPNFLPGSYVASITARDTPGTLRRITALLAQNGVDIIHFHAIRSDDGHSVSMTLKLAVPEQVDLAELQQELELNSDNDDLTVTFQPEEFMSSTGESLYFA